MVSSVAPSTPTPSAVIPSQPLKNEKSLKKAHRSKSSKKETISPPSDPIPLEPQELDPPPKPMLANRWIGGTLTAIPPVFAQTSASLVCCVDNLLRVYHTQTGDLLRQFSSPKDTGAIVAVQLHPVNPHQLVVAYQKGHVLVWDVEDGVLLQTWSRLPSQDVCQFKLFVNKKTNLQAVVVDRNAVTGEQVLQVVSCEGGEGGRAEELQWKVWFEQKRALIKDALWSFEVSPSGQRIYAAFHHDVIVIHVDLKQVGIKFKHDKSIRCITSNPHSPDVFATGDERGQIYLWQSSGKKASSATLPSFTKLHWHAHAVTSLAFSPDGTLLLSGGHEAVLVAWQLDTLKPRFLPRLGGRIQSIVVHQHVYAVCTDGNQVRFVSAMDWAVGLSILGMQSSFGCSSSSLTNSCVLGVDPSDGTLLVQGHQGSLQLWNSTTGQLQLELDVCTRPRLTVNEVTEVKGATLQHVSVSQDGQWLATVDERTFGQQQQADCGEKVWSELSLKFWRKEMQGARKSYTLVTRVIQPHSDAITSLLFRPQSSAAKSSSNAGFMCVTTCVDGSFKLWQPSQSETPCSVQQQRQNANNSSHSSRHTSTHFSWSCTASGAWKPMPITSASFSADGSLLAVAYTNLLTLWNPATLSLRQTLPLPLDARITQLMWFSARKRGIRTREKYLAVVSQNRSKNETRVSVWDVVTGRLQWERVAGACCQIAMDSSAGLLLLVQSEKCNPEQRKSEKLNSNPSLVEWFAPESASVVRKGFLETYPQAIHVLPSSELAILEGGNKIKLIQPDVSASTPAPMKKRTEGGNPSSYLSSIALSSLSTNNSQTSDLKTSVGCEKLDAVLENASHVMPPLVHFYSTFMRLQLSSKGKAESPSRRHREETMSESSREIKEHVVETHEGLQDRMEEDSTTLVRADSLRQWMNDCSSWLSGQV